MSFDYIDDPPSLTQYPPNPNGHFILWDLTPFGGCLITEVVGCVSADPTPVTKHRTQYYPTQYGYNAANASHKFHRMRVNNGTLPLSNIRGRACGNRTDGMCTMSGF
jgi:hypothetical protein